MADKTITTLPGFISVVNTDDSVLTIDAPGFQESKNWEREAIVEIVAGPITFAVGQNDTADSASFNAGEKFVITLRNDDSGKLHFRGATGAETFAIYI